MKRPPPLDFPDKEDSDDSDTLDVCYFIIGLQ
jgi:hypothetical protein